MKKLMLVVIVSSFAALAADVEVTDIPALEKWIAARAKAAKAGQAELVRFPLVHHGTWGSKYPTYYVGTQGQSGEGEATCIAPRWAKGAEEPNTLDPSGRDNGRLAVVEGRFVGTSKKQNDSPDGTEYTLWDFEVLRWRSFHEGGPDEETAKIIATPAQLADAPPALTGDQPWLATLDSFPLAEKESESKASALAEKARKAGYEKAEVIDSRSARFLFCCYRVAIAGRYASQDEATSAMKALKKKGFANAGVRRGW